MHYTSAPATGSGSVTNSVWEFGSGTPLARTVSLSSTTITIAEGETSGTATIAVTDDAEHDPDETIVLAAESVNPELTAPPLTLTIEDNDVVPVPALPVGGALLLGALLVWPGAVRARARPARFS